MSGSNVVSQYQPKAAGFFFALSLVAGIILGVLFESMTVFWVSFLGLAVGIFTMQYSRHMKIETNNAKVIEKSALSALSRVDYYHVTSGGGIAVDASRHQVALIPGPHSPPIIMGPEKIIEYSARMPERLVHSVASNAVGTDLNSAMTASVANMAAKGKEDRMNAQAAAEQEKSTGLYFDLDDLRTPKVFVRMPYEHAENWLLILRKLTDGTLKSTNSPTIYPMDA